VKDCLFLTLTSPLSWKMSAMSEERTLSHWYRLRNVYYAG
jgi:hypothetical protein